MWLQIKEIKALEGPNLYSLSPVIAMDLYLEEYENTKTSTLKGFNDRLLHYFPSLKEHHCSLGAPGGFIARLEEGTLLGHVIEHLALELQHLWGDKVTYGSTRALGDGAFCIIYERTQREVGIVAGEEAFLAVKKLVEGERVDPEAILTHLKDVYRQEALGPSTKELVKAAKEKKIPVIVLDSKRSLIQLGYGAKQRRLAATITEKTSCLAADIASDKAQTKDILRDMGLPVAKGFVVKSREEALNRLQLLDFPVVIKPCHGNQGRGVFAGLKNREEVLKAIEIAWEISSPILLEEHIEGKDYRALVVDKRVVAVAQRIPPYVIGDGERSIEDLIDVINQDPKRGVYHEGPLTQIHKDSALLFHLFCQGYDLSTAPKRGEVIALSSTGNLSCGGAAKDVTSLLHPKTRDAVIQAVSSIGLDVAGVDLVIPHIACSLKEEGAIIEVNAAPGLRMHHYPTYGSSQNVSGSIVDMLFPKKEKGKIPIVAITGTNGKTTIARLIAFMLKEGGYVVGCATSEGIFIGQKLLVEGDMTGPWSARYVLKHPQVEAAVLETARGGLLREGLGFETCHLSLISNISSDHLGSQGIDTLEDMAHLKGLLFEVVDEDGFSIINADDPLLLSLSSKAKGELVYTSIHEENIYLQQHIQAKGRGVYGDRQGRIILASKGRREPLLSIDEVPLTQRGLARHQLENVILSTAAAWALGLPLSLIGSSLRQFKGEEHNPGRFQVIQGEEITIILDYGHNIEGYRSAILTAERVFGKPLIGVIGMPGDRRDEDILEVGFLAGESFQKIYCKEDEDLRGRREGEVTELLRRGSLAANRELLFEEIREEEMAIREAICQARAGDTLLIFYEKERRDRVRRIQESLKERESVALKLLET